MSRTNYPLDLRRRRSIGCCRTVNWLPHSKCSSVSWPLTSFRLIPTRLIRQVNNDDDPSFLWGEKKWRLTIVDLRNVSLVAITTKHNPLLRFPFFFSFFGENKKFSLLPFLCVFGLSIHRHWTKCCWDGRWRTSIVRPPPDDKSTALLLLPKNAPAFSTCRPRGVWPKWSKLIAEPSSGSLYNSTFNQKKMKRETPYGKTIRSLRYRLPVLRASRFRNQMIFFIRLRHSLL